MGSADWMPRNLDKRVEILFPVEDETLKEEVIHILNIQLQDNVKAHELQADGSYIKPNRRRKTKLNSQMYFCKEAQSAIKQRKKDNSVRRTFEPLHSDARL